MLWEHDFVSSNLTLETLSGYNSVGRVSAFQAVRRRFEPCYPLLDNRRLTIIFLLELKPGSVRFVGMCRWSRGTKPLVIFVVILVP